MLNKIHHTFLVCGVKTTSIRVKTRTRQFFITHWQSEQKRLVTAYIWSSIKFSKSKLTWTHCWAWRLLTLL